MAGKLLKQPELLDTFGQEIRWLNSVRAISRFYGNRPFTSLHPSCCKLIAENWNSRTISEALSCKKMLRKDTAAAVL
jgi:hypothetical protein